MINLFQHFKKSAFSAAIITLACISSIVSTASATTLPKTVLDYLRQSDKSVQVRFDGVITTSTNDVYLPVLPQRQIKDNETAIVGTETPLAEKPDLITFSNGVYLIRVIRTTSGKLALAKVDPYPIGLKEGLLPQDLLLPGALYIPAELKVILGDLPYNPMPRPEGAELPAAEVFNPTPPSTESDLATERTFDTPSNTIYATQLSQQKLVRFQLTGSADAPPSLNSKEGLKLGCLPINLHGDNNTTGTVSHIAAPCLNTSEVVIIDAETHSIQARITVAAPIAHSISDGKRLWLTHRTVNAITVIDISKRQIVETIDPGIRGYAMAVDDQYLYVSDVSKPSVTVWDRKNKNVRSTLPGLISTAAMSLKAVNHTPLLWLASRTGDNVSAVNLATGKVLKTVNVSKKPVSFAHHPEHPNVIWVVSGGGHSIEKITEKGEVKPWVSLPKGSFPNQLRFLDAHTGLITAVGGRHAYLVGMDNANAGKLTPILLPAKSNAALPVGEQMLATP
jgi:hypothetical protein